VLGLEPRGLTIRVDGSIYQPIGYQPSEGRSKP
jgi:hypothetical protein